MSIDISMLYDVISYPLGVPKTWKSYEDIAEFFSRHCRFRASLGDNPECFATAAQRPANWDDRRVVYGHQDYGALNTMPLAPSLQWRYTDAWFSMAGLGDQGLPWAGVGTCTYI